MSDFDVCLRRWQRGSVVAESGAFLPGDAEALAYYLEVNAKVRVLGPALVVVQRIEACERTIEAAATDRLRALEQLEDLSRGAAA